ncbi:MAG: site-2 protease family protein [Thermoguttaceae bacterium]
MSDSNLHENTSAAGERQPQPLDAVVYVANEPVAETPPPLPQPQPVRPQWRRPLLLFLATCASTYYVGGPIYALCLITILVCHEMGHFIQARRYGVYSSLPFFIPMHVEPIGTMGAVIGMSSSITNRRALFDIGISGPLAGLVPTILFCTLGLIYDSHLGRNNPYAMQFGEPLLFKLLAWLRYGPIPEHQTVYIGAMTLAGWVGLLITALNLFPIGQLDGGHVLYALLRRKAHWTATLILVGAIVAVVLFRYYWWTLMLVLLMFMGPKHPPTVDDDLPLGTWRTVLGWATLAFLPLGFTPNPFAL